MRHKSVLLKEVINNIGLGDNGIFVDLTLGSAGHSKAVCELGFKGLTIIGLDKDQDAIKRSSKVLADCNAQIILETSPNTSLDLILKKHYIDAVDTILLDLGISSDQLEDSGRGFSFQRDEPLLMTMKKDLNEKDLTAQIIVNHFSEESLADIIYGFGDERYARRIAKKICEYRKQKEIQTTFELVEIIKDATPYSYHKGKIHPATKTFQAIRMVVNDEYDGLITVLNKAFNALKKEGQLLVISFHSIEDRIVKNFIKEKIKTGEGEKVTKKPIAPSKEEMSENPRSRSAKLRVIKKKDE